MSGIALTGVNKYRSTRIPGAEVWALHEPGSVHALCEVVAAHKPELIIELGTGNGGITLPLHEACPEADLLTFDLFTDLPGSEFITTNQGRFTDGWHYSYPPEFLRGNTPRAWFGPQVRFCAAETTAGVPAEAREALSEDRRTCVYCDGGNTAAEVAGFAHHLRTGDLLGVHDWGAMVNETAETQHLGFFRRHRWEVFEANGWMTRFWVRV